MIRFMEVECVILKEKRTHARKREDCVAVQAGGTERNGGQCLMSLSLMKQVTVMNNENRVKTRKGK